MTSNDQAASDNTFTVGVLQSRVIEVWPIDQLLRLKGLIEVEINARTMRAIRETKKSNHRSGESSK